MRVLIIDGYNVLRRAVAYRELAEEDLDAARAALVSDIAAYSVGEARTTVVFDGAGNPASTGEAHEIAGITVVFSPHGVDADTVIERIARQARERGDRVSVVTSDAHVQWTVMGGHVARVPADEFAADLREGSVEWRDHAPAGSRAGRLEDRINGSVRDVLSRWARGDA